METLPETINKAIRDHRIWTDTNQGNTEMLKEFETVTSSEQETIHLGATIGGMLRPGDLILLIGELGSGKTRLAKGIVSVATGIDPDEVVSPTFTLINCFEGLFQVCHADLYRIGSQQIEGIGLEDALDDGAALIVEWAEKIPELNEDSLRIYIMYHEEEYRRQFRLAWREKMALGATGWRIWLTLGASRCVLFWRKALLPNHPSFAVLKDGPNSFEEMMYGFDRAEIWGDFGRRP